MSKFRKKSGGGIPAVNTAALPDIVFMLLFFFMVTTVMREVDLKIDVTRPKATEVNKLEKKSLVSYIYIGSPKDKFIGSYGTADRIQLNDAFATKRDIIAFVEGEKESHDPQEIPYLTWSLKVDKEAKMGIVTDVKQELRKANALKINYSTYKTDIIVD